MKPLRSLLRLVTKRSEPLPGSSKRPKPFRPALEALEARETPSSLAHTADSICFVGDAEGKNPTGPFGMVAVQKGNHVTYIAPC